MIFPERFIYCLALTTYILQCNRFTFLCRSEPEKTRSSNLSIWQCIDSIHCAYAHYTSLPTLYPTLDYLPFSAICMHYDKIKPTDFYSSNSNLEKKLQENNYPVSQYLCDIWNLQKIYLLLSLDCRYLNNDLKSYGIQLSISGMFHIFCVFYIN